MAKSTRILHRIVELELPEGLVPSREAIVYVSGQITAPTAAQRRIHIARAELVGLALIEAGFTPYVPHKGNTYEEVDDIISWEDYMEMDLVVLRRLNAICMVPGWDQRSDGARVEYQHARRWKMPVLWARFHQLLARELVA